MLLQHLEDRVDWSEAAVQGEREGLEEEMGSSEMVADLSHLGVRITNPRLGKEPVIFRVLLRPDRAVWSWLLAELNGDGDKVVQVVEVEKDHGW